ncbi:hypothetical protein BBJ28_00023505 [Nothophytophthora sp. Chile5]|nr:hypothetical protein BBJ28_00023505 [Nothophytophthora sp. Chile5]
MEAYEAIMNTSDDDLDTPPLQMLATAQSPLVRQHLDPAAGRHVAVHAQPHHQFLSAAHAQQKTYLQHHGPPLAQPPPHFQHSIAPSIQQQVYSRPHRPAVTQQQPQVQRRRHETGQQQEFFEQIGPVTGFESPQYNTSRTSAQDMVMSTPQPSDGVSYYEHAEPEPETAATPSNMFKLKRQHRPELWSFIRLVPASSFADLPTTDLESSHAKCAFCIKCKTPIPFQKGVTVAVKRHMETYHADSIREYCEKKNGAKRTSGVALSGGCGDSKVSTSEVSDAVEISRDQQAHANNLVALWIAKSQRPFSTVEDDGLIAYVKYITDDLGGVKVKLPSRTQLRDDIMLVARQLRVSVKAMIKRDCRYFSVTTDIWTSRNTDSYMALTLHYVTPDFRFCNWTLEVESFPGRHSGDAIARGLSMLFERWGLLPQFCVKLLRDGASNAVLAGETLGIAHMSCVAHSLHLVLAGALIKRKPGRAPVSQLDTRTTTDPPEEKDESSCLPDQSNLTYLNSEIESGVTNLQSQQIQSDGLLRDNADETSGDFGDADVADALGSSGTAVVVSLIGAEEADEVEEAEPWLQERAWMELGEFLDTWLALEEKPALEKLRDIVQKFRNIAVYLHKSPKAKKRLESIQVERVGCRPLKVMIDCPTRWNSARDMLARMIELKTALSLFFAYLTSTLGSAEFKDVKLSSPKPEDWFAVKCLLSLLDPFAAITEELSGGYPTLSTALPYLRYIKTQLNRTDLFEEDASLEGLHGYVNETLSLMDSIRRALQSLFEKRFENLPSEVLWISLLDPRLTDMDALDDDEKPKAKHCLVEAALAVATEFVSTSPPTPESRPSKSPLTKKARSSMRAAVFGKRASRRKDRQFDAAVNKQLLRARPEQPDGSAAVRRVVRLLQDVVPLASVDEEKIDGVNRLQGFAVRGDALERVVVDAELEWRQAAMFTMRTRWLLLSWKWLRSTDWPGLL